MARIVRWFLVFIIVCSGVPVRVAALDEPPAIVTSSIVETPVSKPADVTPVVPVSPSLSLPQAVIVQPVRTGMMISYVQTYGDKDASNEVVAITNASAASIDITNWCVKRASSGAGATISTLACFTPQTLHERLVVNAGESLLMASKILSDFIFSPGMSETGGAVLLLNATAVQVDAVAWGNNSNYAEANHPAIAPKQGEALVRQLTMDGQFIDSGDNANDIIVVKQQTIFTRGALTSVDDYCLNIDNYQASVPVGMVGDEYGNCASAPMINTCQGARLSEVGANLGVQFIEIYNSSDQPINLNGCRLMTNRASANYAFDDLTLAAGQYHEIEVGDTGLTVTKTTTGIVYLLSSDGLVEVDSTTYKNLAADTSWSLFEGVWRQTYEPTAGRQNSYQQFLNCEDGYVRNIETGRCNKLVVVEVATCKDDQYRSEETGRCRTIVPVVTLAPCKDGQYRSEETNRCRSLVATASVLKACADDQFRNPDTGRCKKIASSDDVALADCGEGRERNPDTNRCRSVAAVAIPSAAFAVTPIADTGKAFVGWWALGGVGLLAVGYGAWEWRREVMLGVRKVGAFFASRK